MINRDEYLKLIEEIRNTEKKSLDEYIEQVIEPLRESNNYFLETLYKDIHYLTKDIDKQDENDLAIVNGDLVIENADLKLTGYQSRLHNLSIWLHIEIAKQFIEKNPFSFNEKIEDFEKNFLNKPNYTPEFKAKLDKIKRSLIKEKSQNLNEKESLWNKIFDLDVIELKPNISGIGINFSELIKRLKK